MNCLIEYEKNITKFYSGQEVRGTLKLNCDKTREVAGVFLIIEGTVESHWSETEGTGDDSKSVSYGGTQQLIFTKIPLLQNQESSVTLKPGLHIYDFNFLLHPLLPSSYQNLYGKIQYSVSLKVARLEKLKFDKNFKFFFDVVSFVDLNLQNDPNLRLPLKAEISKTFMFSSKSLKISAFILKRAFASGENISITVEIENDTRVEVISTILSLIREFTFKCDGISTKNDSDLLIKSEQQGVKEKSKNQATYSFQIPEGLFPPITTKYIDAFYKIEITAKVGGMHISPRIYLPIFIGTVPLKE